MSGPFNANQVESTSDAILGVLQMVADLDHPMSDADRIRSRARLARRLADKGSMRTLDLLEDLARRTRRHRPQFMAQLLAVEPEELDP